MTVESSVPQSGIKHSKGGSKVKAECWVSLKLLYQKKEIFGRAFVKYFALTRKADLYSSNLCRTSV